MEHENLEAHIQGRDVSNGNEMISEGAPDLPELSEADLTLLFVNKNDARNAKLDDEDEVLEMLYGPANEEGVYDGEDSE